ncbi:HAD family hydrolase [Youngiibacter multivorans]|uniref:Cof subfamily protein (Haloacid dehalogenase superfamily) n=1 Tax=Youngiibacter multivorans TaxID=937251 RepID=A0ABS4G3Q6_9CLOT|nr:HAD family hydrolase [Youngiibacter multivorans]MBP1919171.1 Cof subfamily protein (haloacid dehalogenase superfamily) [Youngiibacter multivorans]
MQRKLICSDLDGTLLGSDRKVSLLNMEVIKELMKRGHIFTVATGRIFQSAKYISSNFGDNVPLIASNGSVYDTGDGKLHKNHFDEDLSAEMFRMAKSFGVTLSYFTHDTVFSNTISGALITKLIYNKGVPKNYRVRTLLAANESIIRKNSDSIVNGIVVSKNNPGKLSAMRAELEKLSGVTIQSSGRDNIELIPGNVDKSYAVKALAEHYGIARQDVICFGDGENDITMLKYAGLGFAMANASDSVKKSADSIAPPNHESGIGLKLMELFGMEEMAV